MKIFVLFVSPPTSKCRNIMLILGHDSFVPCSFKLIIINRTVHCQSHCQQREADNKHLFHLSFRYLFISVLSRFLYVSHIVGNITTDGQPKEVACLND